MVQRSVGNGAPQRHKAWGLSHPSEPPSTKTSGTHLGNRCWLLGSDGQMTKLTTAHDKVTGGPLTFCIDTGWAGLGGLEGLWALSSICPSRCVPSPT